jgi:hypothetical protein
MAILYKLKTQLPSLGFYCTAEDPSDSLGDFDGVHRLDKAKKEALAYEVMKITDNFHSGISFFVWECSDVELTLADVRRLTAEKFIFEDYFEADTENYSGYHAGLYYNV